MAMYFPRTCTTIPSTNPKLIARLFGAWTIWDDVSLSSEPTASASPLCGQSRRGEIIFNRASTAREDLQKPQDHFWGWCSLPLNPKSLNLKFRELLQFRTAMSGKLSLCQDLLRNYLGFRELESCSTVGLADLELLHSLQQS